MDHQDPQPPVDAGDIRAKLENIDYADLEQRLRAHLRILCEEIGTRSIYTFANLLKAEHYVTAALEEAGFLVEKQFFAYRGHRCANLVGRDPSHTPTGRQYILCAHYDTAWGTPGADDNASAVAILLEVARLARTAGTVVRDTAAWRMVAFTTEEPPAFHTHHQGSRVFARQARRQKQRIDGVVNLEMLGYFKDVPRSQHYPFPARLFGYPDRGNFVGVVGNWRSRRLARDVVTAMRTNTALPVHKLIVPERGFLLFFSRLSDHSSFWDHGYPAVMLTDTAFLRNPHYHGPSDSPDTLDFASMVQVVRSLLNCLRVVHEQ
jgi:Peptidase family M28